MTIKLLIDTDPAMGTKESDPEDSFAITLALNSPEIEVVGITCVAGNVPVANGYANARRLLALLGREDVPLAAGPALPLAPYRRPAQIAFLDDGAARDFIVDPKDIPEPAPDAIPLISRLAREAQGELHIAAIGPLTNIALALRRDPELVDLIAKLHVMGGAFEVSGNHTPYAEFNLWGDPEAADEVVRAGLDINFVGLDVCNQTRLTRNELNPDVITSELGRFVIESCDKWFGAVQGSSSRGIHLFDSLTIASIVDPGILEWTEAWVTIDSELGLAQGSSGGWMEHLHFWQSKPNDVRSSQVALGLDGERFTRMFAERVLSLL